MTADCTGWTDTAAAAAAAAAALLDLVAVHTVRSFGWEGEVVVEAAAAAEEEDPNYCIRIRSCCEVQSYNVTGKCEMGQVRPGPL